MTTMNPPKTRAGKQPVVIYGSSSPAYLRLAAREVSRTIPQARLV